jgi:hypothetical protein
VPLGLGEFKELALRRVLGRHTREGGARHLVFGGGAVKCEALPFTEQEFP